MAAPTPVSALVHSSTLVTAGVYLLFRFAPLILNSGLFILLVSGCLTILMAGFSALYEIDMKKIVALSTLRQLGLIVATLASGLAQIAFFHLLVHAYFKALLFMRVGRIIHLSSDYQDLRKISLLPHRCPARLTIAVLANLSLCGLPFLGGFYSKDLSIEGVMVVEKASRVVGLFLVATFLTSAYTARFVYLLLIALIRTPSFKWSNDKDSSMQMAIRILAPLAVMGGRFLSWHLFLTPSRICLLSHERFLVFCTIALGSIYGIIYRRDLS